MTSESSIETRLDYLSNLLLKLDLTKYHIYNNNINLNFQCKVLLQKINYNN